MKRTSRTIAVLVGVGGLLGSASGTASADVGSGRYPIHAAPFTSSVCGFDVKATFPTDREYETDSYDASGTLVRATVTGELSIVLTRADTGQSIERNLSGEGTYDFHPDGSFTLSDEGHLLYGLHPGDAPGQPGLYVTSGRTVIEFAATGQRTVTQSSGGTENACTTLG